MKFRSSRAIMMCTLACCCASGVCQETGTCENAVADGVDIDSDSFMQLPKRPPHSKNCTRKLEEATSGIAKCLFESKMAMPEIREYALTHHMVTKEKFDSWLFLVAEEEGISSISGECDPVKDLKQTWEEVSLLRLGAERAVKKLIDMELEMLEDPRVPAYLHEKLGSEAVASIFEKALLQFGEICESDAKTLEAEVMSCKDHVNLKQFLRAAVPHPESCSSKVSKLFQTHQRLRHGRNHGRAQVVQVLHNEKTNNLGKYFAVHLRHGGSESAMDLLMSHAINGGKDLTSRQRELLQHIEDGLPTEHLDDWCNTWSSLREAENLDSNTRNNVLIQSKVYRSYMDCMCGRDELRLVCQGNFMQDFAGLKELHDDLKRRHHQHFTDPHEGEHVHEVAAGEVNTAIETNSSAAPSVGPCLLADAFSCEVCLSRYCAPIASRPVGKGRKNTKNEPGPFVVIKNALTASETDFKISCTACASIHPGEQISFELEMYAATNLQDQHSLFTKTEIGVDAKTCMGPGSPLRVSFDTLGLPTCVSNFKAKYFPFLGDLSVEGFIPGKVPGSGMRAVFDARVHDLPEAVRAYCRRKNHVSCGFVRDGWASRWVCSAAQSQQRCISNYESMAGPLWFSANVHVPLVFGRQFTIVQIGGPVSFRKGFWMINLFEIPFNDVLEAIKKVWDEVVGPVMEDALNTVGIDAKAAGKWTAGAANDAGKWTVGAAKDAGKFAKDAGNAVSKTVSDVGKALGNIFSFR